MLGHQGYIGMEKYIMWGFNKIEIRVMGLALGVVKDFNKMHSGHRVRVE